MDIHHLKIFFEACNEKSFTKAAKKLYISQSAVSIQIKKLEYTLGLQLIERNSKNFKLTFAGKELFKMSQDVFEKISRMENEMKKILQYKKGKISIGATHNIGEPVLPRIMIEFRKNNPEIEFDLYIKNRESLVKHLKEGTVDIALMEEFFIEDKEIKVIETEEFPFVAGLYFLRGAGEPCAPAAAGPPPPPRRCQGPAAAGRPRRRAVPHPAAARPAAALSAQAGSCPRQKNRACVQGLHP